VSNIGTFMQGAGAVWVMLELRQSTAVVTLAQTAVALPCCFWECQRGRWPT
jgi:hypothetical protein